MVTCSRTTETAAVALVACLVATACREAAAPPPITGAAAEVRALTGARTRLAWGQHDGRDPLLVGDQVRLMGFDTDDGRGDRPILERPGSYVRPMITPRGDRVVYSTRPEPGPPEVFVVGWDGTGLRKLADGFGMALWADPADGREWVYVAVDQRRLSTSTVVRLPLDDPGRRENVWTKSPVGIEGFHVSRDGRHASAPVPWPKVGILELPNGRLRVLGQGCWPSLTDARGPLLWYFDGAHRNVTLVDVDTEARWMVNINDAPGFDGAEVFHPRWTNHPRVLAISGPYNQGGANQARTGGPQVEVYLGRFSEDYADVERWVRVTENAVGDSYPDAWIDPNEGTLPRRPSGPLGPAHVRAGGLAGAGSSPTDTGRLLVNVQLVAATPVPTPESILPYRHALVVNEYEVGEVVRGEYGEKRMRVAQWAIRDGRILPDARRMPGNGATLTVERYDAHPELEGERLLAASPSSLPLYYDVSAGR